MSDVRLFLGFPIENSFSEELEKINPAIKILFIQDSGNYLQEVLYHRKRYLGKFTEPFPDSPAFELLEANIYSLLHKLVPNYPYKSTPLILFPVKIT